MTPSFPGFLTTTATRPLLYSLHCLCCLGCLQHWDTPNLPLSFPHLPPFQLLDLRVPSPVPCPYQSPFSPSHTRPGAIYDTTEPASPLKTAISEAPKQENTLPLPEVADGQVGTLRVHVPFPVSYLSQVHARVGSFSQDPSRFIQELQAPTAAFDLT